MAEIKAKMQAKATEIESLANYFIFADGFSSFNSSEYTVFPGFCDVHVHFREPGFSYKETMATGSLASARGGYTDVCTMPNLNPVPDSVENLEAFLEDGGYELSVDYGTADKSHRYYLLTTDAGDFLFGYDSRQHIPHPVYKASIIIGLKLIKD